MRTKRKRMQFSKLSVVNMNDGLVIILYYIINRNTINVFKFFSISMITYIQHIYKYIFRHYKQPEKNRTCFHCYYFYFFFSVIFISVFVYFFSASYIFFRSFYIRDINFQRLPWRILIARRYNTGFSFITSGMGKKDLVQLLFMIDIQTHFTYIYIHMGKNFGIEERKFLTGARNY